MTASRTGSPGTRGCPPASRTIRKRGAAGWALFLVAYLIVAAIALAPRGYITGAPTTAPVGEIHADAASGHR